MLFQKILEIVNLNIIGDIYIEFVFVMLFILSTMYIKCNKFKKKVNLMKTSESITETFALHLETTFNSINDGIITVHTNRRISMINIEANRLTGWLNNEAIGRKISDVFKVKDEKTGKFVANPIEEVIDTRSIIENLDWHILVSKDGKKYSISYSTVPIYDDCSVFKGVVLVFRDITSQKAMDKKLKYIAYHDTLTNLFNRAGMQHEMENAIKLNMLSTYAAVFIDLDNFKYINDIYGHEEGDKFLVQIADVLKEHSLLGSIIGRQSGDEFLIFCQINCKEEMMISIENIIKNIKRKITDVEGNEIHLSASAGIAFYPEDAENRSKLLSKADMAMYKAKRMGKNQYYVYNDSILKDMKNNLDK